MLKQNIRKEKDSAALRWIYEVAGSGRKWLVLLLAARTLQAAVSVGYALALRNVVDSAVSGVKSAFFQQLGAFAALILTVLLLQTLIRDFTERARAALEKNFRLRVFQQILVRDYAQITALHTGDWMNRITSDENVVVNALITVFPGVVSAVTRILSAVIVLFGLVPQVVYVLVPAGLLMLAASVGLRRQLKQLHRKIQQADGSVRSFLQERLASLLVVHTFTQEAQTAQMASEKMDELAAARMKRLKFMNLCNLLMHGALQGAQLFGIALCSWGILQGKMTYGTMSAILHLISQLETPFANMSAYFPQYYAMLASAERMMEVEQYAMDCEEKPRESEAVQSFYEKCLTKIVMEDVSFSYPGDGSNIVLQNVNLELKKGEFVAFTGQSGCGKSTAVKMLLCLYPMLDGKIRLEQTDHTAETLDASWRGLFAYVPQGNHLIAGTIREVLTFGDSEQMQKETALWDALRVACAEDFVKQLPAGLDTLLGERGTGLSEGQMQRIALARAVMSRRPILLLDEATSALDAETERQVLQNLRSMTQCTVVLITHREAALEVCDRRIRFAE